MRLLKFVPLLFILLVFSAIYAQGEAICPTIVTKAIAITDAACDDLGRNEVCYGHSLVNTVNQPDVILTRFEYPGDLTAVTSIESMMLSPMNLEVEDWGIVLMQIQANLPDTLPGQNVSFVLFGDVEIFNNSEAMEAFYFRTGIGDALCEEAPDSGILIRTPEGTADVTLVANDVEITLGSTAYLTAEADGAMTVAMVDGQAAITAGGQTEVVEAGFFTTIPMDEFVRAKGVPSTPQVIPTGTHDNLPVVLLPDSESDTASTTDDTISAVSVSQGSCAEGEIAHLIQRGENLFRISLRYGVPQSAIAQRNLITNPAQIFAGVTLCIPTGGFDSGITSVVPDESAPTNTTSATTDSESFDNWCDPGGPWEDKCSITDDLALRNLLWRCGWYFARGLSSYECGSPPDGPRIDPTTIEPTTIEPTSIEPTSIEPTSIEPTSTEAAAVTEEAVTLLTITDTPTPYWLIPTLQPPPIDIYTYGNDTTLK